MESGLFVFDTGARQLARLPVAMDAPYSLKIRPTARRPISAVRMATAMHVLRMGQAEETINLDTGKTEGDWGPVGRGWIGRGKDPRLVLMPDASARTAKRRSAGTLLDESSGSCALDVFTVGDIRRGRLLRDFRPHYPASVYGFSSRDTLLAMFWQDGRERLVQVNMRSGKQSPTAIAAPLAQAAPDGKSILVAPGPAVTANGQLELYRVPPDEPIYQQSGDLRRMEHGRRAARRPIPGLLGGQQGVPCVRLISTADGRYVEVPLADFVAAHAKQIDAPPRVWRLALDDSGGRLAVAMAGPDRGLVGVASRKKRPAIRRCWRACPIWSMPCYSSAAIRLLTGSSKTPAATLGPSSPPPALDGRNEGAGRAIRLRAGSPNVVCCNLYRNGVVLRLEDGKAVYKSPPCADELTLLFPGRSRSCSAAANGAGDGRQSMQLRLVELATGRVALTYCGLSEGQWIASRPPAIGRLGEGPAVGSVLLGPPPCLAGLGGKAAQSRGDRGRVDAGVSGPKATPLTVFPQCSCRAAAGSRVAVCRRK